MAYQLNNESLDAFSAIGIRPAERCFPLYSTQTSSYNGIQETLIINICLFLLIVIMFSLLRKSAWNYGRTALVNRANNRLTTVLYGNRSTEQYPEDAESVDAAISRQDVGLFQWILQTFELSDEMMMQRCGPDAVQYQKFQRYLVACMAFTTMLCVVIVLPLNFFNRNSEEPMNSFGELTMSNLHPNSRVMYVHCLVGLVLLGLVIACMKLLSRSLSRETDETKSETLMISNIPRDQCFQHVVMQHFQEAYPELLVHDIQFAYDVAKLVYLEQCRLEAAENFAQSLVMQQELGEPLMMVPCYCGQSCFKCLNIFRVEKADCVKFYAAELAKYEEQCEEEKLTALQRAIGIAFVTFTTESMSSRFVQDFHKNCWSSHNPATSSLSSTLMVQNWVIKYASAPEDILWGNLSTSRAACKARDVCVNLCWFILLIFLTAPSVVLNQLGQLEFSKHFNELVINFLPSILLLVCTLILPIIVYWSDEYFIPHWTKSGMHLSTMRKTFAFLVLTVIVLPSAGLAGINAALEIVRVTTTNTGKNDHHFHWNCVFVGSNNAFFVNYLISATFIGLGLELLRVQDLLLTGFKILCARSVVERAAVIKVTENPFSYGRNYAKMLCTFTAVMAYSIPCPVITPIGLIYLVMKYYLDRYNIYYCNTTSKVSREIHITAMNYVVVAAVILQVILLLFLIVRADEMADINVFAVVELCAVVVLLSVRSCCAVVYSRHPFDYKNIPRNGQDGAEESEISQPHHIEAAKPSAYFQLLKVSLQCSFTRYLLKRVAVLRKFLRRIVKKHTVQPTTTFLGYCNLHGLYVPSVLRVDEQHTLTQSKRTETSAEVHCAEKRTSSTVPASYGSI